MGGYSALGYIGVLEIAQDDVVKLALVHQDILGN
jgi:hypothetical protein